ncbi:hypothetical protein C2845_PM03G25920 [Panicum miliaceum]|uniref:Uncharacterized protein n=1 Tax=Panicum miliaceum TaxID=4540 RepID=A0A3L6TCE8_PANMI|nr:hypothetical protein C2845_PM03G25920 [Panicum miliaceum]
MITTSSGWKRDPDPPVSITHRFYKFCNPLIQNFVSMYAQLFDSSFSLGERR